MAKGYPMAPGATKPFQKGNDPRRNLKGRPESDAVVAEIKADVKVKLAKFFQKFFDQPFEELQKLIDSKTLTTGEMVALKFLKLAGEQGTPAQISVICKIFGLETPDQVKLNVNISLEDLITQANSIETTAVVVKGKEEDE